MWLGHIRNSYASASWNLSIPYAAWRDKPRSTEEATMLDVILIAVGCGLFWLAVAYSHGCSRL